MMSNAIINTLLIRLQNRNIIVSIVSGILLILTSTGMITLSSANHINDIINTILSLLVGVGILSNPESHLLQQPPQQPPQQ